MVNQAILQILTKRILEGWIYPKTNLPLCINDILIEEYKNEIAKILKSISEEAPNET